MREPGHIRLLRLLLWLYPATFRRRHGASIVATAREHAAKAGRVRAVAVLLDGAWTCVRAWQDTTGRQLRGMNPRRAVAALTTDARLTLRALRRRPQQGVVVVVTLAIALGANAAIYTITHTLLLLATLPYDSPERIMTVSAPPLDMVRAGDGFSWKVGKELRTHPGVEDAATYYEDAGANLVAGSDASRVRITQVSPTFFDVLGVRMHIGPGIDDDVVEDRAVLSQRLWQRAFGSAADVIGRTIVLSGRTYRITGVAPAEVDFPNATEIWLTDPPVSEFFARAFGPSVMARLRPGAEAVVTTALAAYGVAERAAAGPEYASYVQDPTLTPLRDTLVASVDLPLLVLSAAAAVVLLLGCVNVAGVTLARLVGRRQELTMRRALGASRARVFAQLMAELGVLALVAASLSMLLAVMLVPLLASLLPPGTPRLDAAAHITQSTWVFAGVAAVIAMLVAGLPPALTAARGYGGDIHPDRIRTTDSVRQRGQGVLTMIQVALAVTLVVTATLLGRTVAELRAVPLGYDTESVLTFHVSLPEATYADAIAMNAYVEELLTRLMGERGVIAAGASTGLPFAQGLGVAFGVYRADASEESRVSSSHRLVTTDYFRALGTRIIAGQSFSPRTGDGGEVVLSRALAVQLFGGAPAVGQRVTIRGGGAAKNSLVVGVVDDVRFTGAQDSIRPAFYENLLSSWSRTLGFAVRVSGEPSTFVPLVRRVAAELDTQVPVFALRTTGEAASSVIAARRAVAIVASLFGVAALLLSLLALYGMLAQGVALRRRELGIRLALGAPVRQVERLVIARGLSFTMLGLALGLLLCVAATRLLRGLLFGVAPNDVRVLAATGVAVLVAALAASWLPARRAGRTDPMTSLRAD